MSAKPKWSFWDIRFSESIDLSRPHPFYHFDFPEFTQFYFYLDAFCVIYSTHSIAFHFVSLCKFNQQIAFVHINYPHSFHSLISVCWLIHFRIYVVEIPIDFMLMMRCFIIKCRFQFLLIFFHFSMNFQQMGELC